MDEEGSLDETDFANGDAIDLDTEIPEGENPLRDAIEKGHLFEGDILLNPEQTATIADESEDRSATTVPNHKWKKYGGNVIIPYTITKSYDSQERANIARAITEYRKNTCLRYTTMLHNVVDIVVLSTSQTKYIYIYIYIYI